MPTDGSTLGPSALRTEPIVEQMFISAGGKYSNLQAEQQVRCCMSHLLALCIHLFALDTHARFFTSLHPHLTHNKPAPISLHTLQMFVLRKLIEKELRANDINEDECYFCSLSTKTIVYKGQLTTKQVCDF